MGLFSKRKKQVNDNTNNVNVFLSNEVPRKDNDMVSLVQAEKKEIVNPFVESAPTMAQKSIAKQYGDKYIGSVGRQIASSKVVDVRSYKKPTEKKIEVSKDEITIPPKKSSFFDEIMKSLDEEDDETDILENENQDELRELEVSNPSKEVVESKKVTSSKPKKKKVDIDIISGDFGGTDII